MLKRKINHIGWKVILATSVRIYLGWRWLTSGLGKFGSSAWTGEQAGVAVNGFLAGALEKTGGAHPEVQAWYGWFIENIAQPNAAVFSYLVVFGEILAGISLLIGGLTFIGLLGGAFMNTNYLLAGTSSANPVMLLLTLIIFLNYYKTTRISLDYYLANRCCPILLNPGAWIFKGDKAGPESV